MSEILTRDAAQEWYEFVDEPDLYLGVIDLIEERVRQHATSYHLLREAVISAASVGLDESVAGPQVKLVEFCPLDDEAVLALGCADDSVLAAKTLFAEHNSYLNLLTVDERSADSNNDLDLATARLLKEKPTFESFATDTVQYGLLAEVVNDYSIIKTADSKIAVMVEALRGLGDGAAGQAMQTRYRATIANVEAAGYARTGFWFEPEHMRVSAWKIEASNGFRDPKHVVADAEALEQLAALIERM